MAQISIEDPGPITEWTPTPIGKGPEKWRSKYRDSLSSGGIYCFGSKTLQDEVVKAHKIQSRGKHTAFPYNTQYDILMRCYLFYEDYPEINWMPQEEFFWMAAAIRFPVNEDVDGRPMGAFIRSPWGEHMIHALTHHDYVAVVGSAGCGKTMCALTWSLMCWEFYMGVPGDGGRVVFASVTEQKLQAAAYAHLISANRASQDNIGTYVGKSDVRASLQLRRANLPGKGVDNKSRDFMADSKSVMQGVLLGGVSEAQILKKVDVISGSHNKHFLAVCMDEFQSCSTAAISAAYNLLIHPRVGKIILLGNLARKDDPLGSSITPLRVGWDDIKPEHCAWIGRDRDDRTVYVVRFNNDFSPGVDNPTRYWFLPTTAKRDKAFTTPASRLTPGYQRFWQGSFVSDLESDTILTPQIIKVGGANKYPLVDRTKPAINFCAFDSAPASIDRSVLLHCKLVVEQETGQWVLWFYEAVTLPKTAKETYYHDTAISIRNEMERREVGSGAIILDDSASTGFGEELIRLGIDNTPVKFQSKPTESLIDFSTDKKASEYCNNLRAEMFSLLSIMTYNGQVRGLTEEFCHDWRKELCTLRWKQENTRGKAQAEPKVEFKARMGFSPDVLDTMAMACLMARDHFGFVPGGRDKQLKFTRLHGGAVIEEHEGIWPDQSEFDEGYDAFTPLEFSSF